MRRPSSSPSLALLACVVLLSAGCALTGGRASVPPGSVLPPPTGGWAAGSAPVGTVAVPGRLTGRLYRADLIVVAPRTLPTSVRRRVAATAGVVAVVPVALATAPVRERMLTVAAVDPSSYRPFTPEVTARSTAVWRRVAEGELAVSPTVAAELGQPLGEALALGNDAGSLTLRVGAAASMPPRIDAVVNEVRGHQLGMVPGNAVLVSTGDADPAEVAEELRRRLRGRATVSPLTDQVPVHGQQTAFLTGGAVAAAVGSFRYRYHEDGTVVPDPAWVAANVRTEAVPLLGNVTCHRVMLPQLRGALQEIVDRGLGELVDPGDFGGCYAPRFIARDPAKGLSLHTWGIAVDLNVQGNLRGTAGGIDRRVVAVLKRWGFAWGGDWSYTDPMHFELAALIRPR
jgi:hypothetical protein